MMRSSILSLFFYHFRYCFEYARVLTVFDLLFVGAGIMGSPDFVKVYVMYVVCNHVCLSFFHSPLTQQNMWAELSEARSFCTRSVPSTRVSWCTS